jgi:hypothetical protein
MKRDIKTFNAVCKQYRMSNEQRYEFSEYIHERKDSGFMGSAPRGDFTFRELCELAEEFLGLANGNGNDE